MKFNLRSEILSEVQKQGSTKLPSNKSILVLGDNATGKTTLIAKLQGVEDPKKGSGLEYAYIDVKDEYRDGNYLNSLCCYYSKFKFIKQIQQGLEFGFLTVIQDILIYLNML